ncbi:MAG: N-acetylmuramoyl-L-alanine amidase [Bacilli bacterium]|jgi:N-acetylmuramoyl-L-alanine amidase|nr:N-acetylmuramoyl-L-alanine amidase [Bacilli bacterium]MDY5996291.1 N-acetylmuramoyl-L-alanine amidase [Bacilli bacterium]
MNKYKLLILICFFLLTISLPNVTASINNLNLLGKIIVLDAGHGGTDSGAKNGKIVEKELNLLLVKKLEKELISRGATVYLTREEDNDLSARTSERKRSDLYNRAKYINTIKPNMYISIHLNATTSSSWKGLQVFYNKNNEENKVIAETITNNLKNNINNIREVKEENKYYMYKYIKYPGVLIEAGFISNPDENYLLRQEEYQNKLIILIADAIEKYYQK